MGFKKGSKGGRVNREDSAANRAAILAAAPGSVTAISERTGISKDVVCRWLRKMEIAKETHICAFEKPPQGGKSTPIWKAGPRKPGFKVQHPPKTLHAMRVAEWRAAVKARAVAEVTRIPSQAMNPLCRAMSAFGAPQDAHS